MAPFQIIFKVWKHLIVKIDVISKLFNMKITLKQNFDNCDY